MCTLMKKNNNIWVRETLFIWFKFLCEYPFSIQKIKFSFLTKKGVTYTVHKNIDLE